MMQVKDEEVSGLKFLVVVFVLVLIEEVQTKSFLINCGTNSTVNVDGRRWVGDLAPDNNLTLTAPGTVASTATFHGDSASAQLYETARIFTDNLIYTFRATQGNYFLRLHFFPFPFENYNANKSSFNVVANGLKLVAKFNVPVEISRKNFYKRSSGSNSSSFVLIKEYFLNVESGVLVIDFTPTRGSFGFVNAIEIVPVVHKLFDYTMRKVGGNGANASINLSKLGLETIYRLNVGGSKIKPSEDLDLWRMWEVDSSYMLTADAGSEISNSSSIAYASGSGNLVAPLLVYETARTMSNTEVMDKRFNMSWKFEVDPDFDYVIRLHFCELVYEKANQRSFRIYINNRTAADTFDVFVRAGGMNKAYHEDYVDSVSQKIDTLWIQLGPEAGGGSAGTDAFLNGMEIFKLSRNENLAHLEKYDQNSGGNGTSRSLILWVGIGAGIVSVALIAGFLTLFFCFCKKMSNKPGDIKKNSAGGWPLLLLGAAASNPASAKRSVGHQSLQGSVGSTRDGKRFKFAEIKAATNNFDESLVIGLGGFGKVYKGVIGDGTLAAIKRANPQSEQGLVEFETEIEMLSKLRHRHLVSMIGFCEEQNEMILVYEYMANGTLRSHLFGKDVLPLSWKQRLEVCIGAARGLHYLHTGAERGIIHRDVKTTNILLDEKLVAKMADFGLSKTGPALEHTHVSTAVKGSFGYLDPEYFRRQQLTEKSDIYSFGVVLFEAVCARAVINPSLPKDQINLAEWAIRWQRQRSLKTIIDPHLEGKCSPDSLMIFGEIAEKCLADEGKNRPTMGEVLWHLEYALQVHETWMHTKAQGTSFSSSQVVGSHEEGEAGGGHVSAGLDEEASTDMKESGEKESILKETSASNAVVGFNDFLIAG